ncbi:hypothetical protein ACGVWS_10220 [Enterobacteriaceae bacterium LUAb1]
MEPHSRQSKIITDIFLTWEKAIGQDEKRSFSLWLDQVWLRKYNLNTLNLQMLHDEIIYFNDQEKNKYEVIIDHDGLLRRMQTREILSTSEYEAHTQKNKGIFVLTTREKLYVGYHSKNIRHSSFCGGQDIMAAGEIVVDNGKINLLNRFSGHYKPSSHSTIVMLNFLNKHNVKTDDIKIQNWVGVPDMTCTVQQFRQDYRMFINPQ